MSSSSNLLEGPSSLLLLLITAPFIVGVICTPLEIASADEAPSDELVAARHAFWRAEPLTRDQRRLLAQGWLDDVVQLNDAIPTLSPAQEQWLKTEYDELYERTGGQASKRLINAMNSTEYRLRTAKSFAKANQGILGTLVHPDSIAPDREALLWVMLANNLLDLKFNQSVVALVDTGIIEKSVLKGHSHFREAQQQWARSILGSIVVPLLKTGRTD